ACPSCWRQEQLSWPWVVYCQDLMGWAWETQKTMFVRAHKRERCARLQDAVSVTDAGPLLTMAPLLKVPSQAPFSGGRSVARYLAMPGQARRRVLHDRRSGLRPFPESRQSPLLRS